jgi:hypothetical protein
MFMMALSPVVVRCRLLSPEFRMGEGMLLEKMFVWLMGL